jgi:F-type H+-transporting ATPase subunit b
MHIISNIALICINETLIVQLISFLVFLFIINRVMFRPLIEERSKRDHHIENLKTNIADAIHELDDITKKINAAESKAKKEAMNFKEALKASGIKEASDILESASGNIMHIKEKAESDIEAWLSEAKKSIKKEAKSLCVNILEKVLDRRMT